MDQTDYVELFAPKPWLISSTEGDFFTPAGAKQVFEEARGWYKLYNAEDRVQWVLGPGGHGTPLKVREAIYSWMIQWLKNGDGNAGEQEVELLPDHMLWTTERGQAPGREISQVINFRRRSTLRPHPAKCSRWSTGLSSVRRKRYRRIRNQGHEFHRDQGSQAFRALPASRCGHARRQGQSRRTVLGGGSTRIG